MDIANPRHTGSRGSDTNPPNRFERISFQPDPDYDPAQDPAPATQFLRDASQTLITYNDSPDVGFEASINPYRGCEHGCAYCYARPFHEYLGFSAGLDFETRIMVKEDAPKLLRRELSSRKWKPQVIALSGVTDCYQPIERRLKLTRRCLEVLAEFRNPVTIVTKNLLVTRDLDVLSELARHSAAAVLISLTTLHTDLRKVMEPRTSPPAARLATISALSQARVPVGVLVAPTIPGITDHEIPGLLEAAAKAGARSAAYVLLRLPHAVAPLFERWLETHFPERKEKVLNQLRALRQGKLYESAFGRRMRGEGILAEQIDSLFEVARRRHRLASHLPELSPAAFRRPVAPQMELTLTNEI